MSAYLEARLVSARHPGAEADAVRDVSLSVQAGEIVALIGANGSGKSTLISALGGGLKPRQGKVRLGNRDLYKLRERARARALARLPQSPMAPSGLRVVELVATGRYAWRSSFAGLSRDDRRAISNGLLAVGMEDLRTRNLNHLSGGERRRAWIAMVLTQQTPLMLLDEPTAALDARHQLEVLAHLAEINRDRGTSMIVALHDLSQAAALAHRVAVMVRGRLYAVGRPAEVLTPETLRDAFGVEAEIQSQPRFRVSIHGVADPKRFL